ncbi:MAG: hypothetical protein JNK69_01755 [Saprospiraceae bacterium]|nr:hypothetical protein [Saprospiraceae bacterium]HRG33953.1 hypothetical protein [Saprospiraceae bacterium]
MVTLSDYLGYLFIEITRARHMADQYSVSLAEANSKDPLLKYMSVPRFKIPEMELNVPVLISGAKFNQTLKFTDGISEFSQLIKNELNNSYRKFLLKKNNSLNTIGLVSKIDFSHIFFPGKINTSGNSKKSVKRSNERDDENLNRLITEFYDSLKENLVHEEDLILAYYGKIFSRMLEIQAAMDAYKTLYPNNELFKQSAENINIYINSKTIVDKTTITNLLVSPETNLIKNGASDISVFSVKAKVNEEGIYVKSVRDVTNHNHLVEGEIIYE